MQLILEVSTKFIFFMIDKCLLSKWTNSARESEALVKLIAKEIMEEIHTVLIPRALSLIVTIKLIPFLNQQLFSLLSNYFKNSLLATSYVFPKNQLLPKLLCISYENSDLQ